jgi:hypothetical protein
MPEMARLLSTIPEVGAAGEVWYDPGSNSYYFAHSVQGATEAATTSGAAIGIVNAATDKFVADIPIEGAGVHSVAVNAANNHIFVPVNRRGILVLLLSK